MYKAIVDFQVEWWIASVEGEERLMMSISSRCTEEGCGGRFYVTTCAGKITQEGQYLARNSQALKLDASFSEKTHCTNCGLGAEIADVEAVDTISTMAEESLKGLREARKIAKAPWN